MATPSSGEQITRRNKWVNILVAGAFTTTVITVAVAYWWSRGRAEKARSIPQALPSGVHQQSSGYTFTRSEGGRQVFTIHAARTVALKQGATTVLEEVLVEFFGQANDRHDILRTSRGEYNAQSGEFLSRGEVEIELSAQRGEPSGAPGGGRPPVFLETSGVQFKHPGSLVVSEAPVHFRFGPASGSAKGLTYAVKDGWLELKSDVTAELHLKSRAEPPVRLTAGRVRYDKNRGDVTFWGPVEIVQGERHLGAERGTLVLDKGNHITRATLEGGVRGFDPSKGGSLEFSASELWGAWDPTSGETRSLVAEGEVVAESRRGGMVSHLAGQRVEVAFAGPRPEPKTARVSGKAQLTLEPLPAPSQGGLVPSKTSADRKILMAPQMQFTFRSGGGSLEEAETVGESRLALVSLDGKASQRVITAGQFLMAFDPRSRLESLRGRGHTRVVFEPAPTAPTASVPQETSSERLDATFDTATGLLGTVDQTGDFQFREGGRQASSEQARFAASARVLTLTGRPQVWDATTRVKAERILFNLETDTAEGLGKVQATHADVAGQPGPSPARRAGGSNPTNVLADRMLAARRDQLIHYEGHVRAWHGRDVIESASLDVSRAERRLTSGFRVLTTHAQPASRAAAGSAPSPREARPVTIRADRLEYFEGGRKAGYRGSVQFQAENTTLQADRLDVVFSAGRSAEPSEIERAAASGHITVTQPSRRATGEHADYDPASGKIVLTGGPPTLDDAQKGFTTGERLTFYIHDDRIFVDGGDKSPTLSKHRVAQ